MTEHPAAVELAERAVEALPVDLAQAFTFHYHAGRAAGVALEPFRLLCLHDDDLVLIVELDGELIASTITPDGTMYQGATVPTWAIDAASGRDN